MVKKMIIISLGILVIAAVVMYANPKQIFTKLYLRFSGEYRAPEYETPESIIIAVNDANLHYDRLYRLKGIAAMKAFQEKGIFSIPFIHFYNSEKKIMTVASGNECKWNLMDLFMKSDTLQLVAGDTSMHEFILNNIEPVEIRTDQDTFKYYVIGGWANFLPKMKENLFRQTNEIKETLNDKVCISYINLDFQEEWEAELEAQKK